uniref:Large ribosomal subunit protein eL20 n=1 Tax=Equus asinus TaxID=9793 RepID=A0A8C4MZS0_EQUAS
MKTSGILPEYKLKKKKSSVETVYHRQVFKKSSLQVKNFGNWLHYNSHNLTTVGTVTQCYHDMGAQHQARVHSIQIMKVEEIVASKCHLRAVKQFHNYKTKFLLPHWVLHRQHKPTFTTKMPDTFF